MSERAAALKRVGWPLLRIVVNMAILGVIALGFGGLLLLAATTAVSRFEPSDALETAIYAVVPLLSGLAFLWLIPLASRIGHRLLGPETPHHIIPAAITVTATDDGITLHRSGGESETVLWCDVTEVTIANVDGWPIGEQFFLIGTANGGGLVVPSSADGTGQLLAAMQERFKGFDNEAVIRAMGKLDGSFPVWRRSGA